MINLRELPDDPQRNSRTPYPRPAGALTPTIPATHQYGIVVLCELVVGPDREGEDWTS